MKTIEWAYKPHKRPATARKGVKTSKAPSRSKLIATADKLLSLQVRQFYSNSEGIVKCYTCTYSNHWKKMQNGHYISRFFKYTRWERDNCRPQCFMCNMRLGGCSHIFRENIVKELGEERVREMEAKAKLLFREKDEWIQAIIDRLGDNLKPQGQVGIE